MSKLSTEIKERVIQMPTDKTYRVISLRKTPIYKELFIITGISELEYKKIKASDNLNIIRGNVKFNITPDDVLCYGDIDFHNGSEDCDTLDTFNWLEQLYVKGICIPANYDYDNHQCVTKYKRIMYTETFKNSVLCRYYHACLGKPKYTLIFREIR